MALNATMRIPTKIHLDLGRYELSYRTRQDILTLQIGQGRGGIGLDVGDAYWLFVDPDSGALNMVEIEDFQRRFLVEHAEGSSVSMLWQKHKRELMQKHDALQAQFVAALAEILQQLLVRYPPKVELPSLSLRGKAS